MELVENIIACLIFIGLLYLAAKHIPRIKIASVSKIPISITSGFMFYVGFLGYVGGWEVFLKVLFAYFMVTLHELSHSITAQKFGYRVKSIDLWPMSGLATIDGDSGLATIDGDFDKNPWHEFVIAINGPALNIVAALIFAPLLLCHNSWLNFCFEVNVTLALFNLIPIFPMDGGRVLHALFVWKIKDEDRVEKVRLYSTIAISSVAVPLVAIFWSSFAACLLGFMTSISIMEYFAKRLLKARKRLEILVDAEREHLSKLVREIKEILQLQWQFCMVREDHSGGIKVIQLEREVGIADMQIRTGYISNDFAKMTQARERLVNVLSDMRKMVAEHGVLNEN